jgi:hypothetical protein
LPFDPSDTIQLGYSANFRSLTIDIDQVDGELEKILLKIKNSSIHNLTSVRIILTEKEFSMTVLCYFTLIIH